MADLLALSRFRNYRRGDLMIRQGDVASSVVMVLEGHVKVWRVLGSGKSDVLAFRGRHDVIGRTAVLYGRPRSAYVEALERCRVALVPGASYLALMERHGFMGRVSEDIRERLAETIAVRGGSDVSAQLAFVLTRILDRQRAGGFCDPGPVALHSTQEDLGCHLGIGRNSVSSGLRQLESMGVRRRRGRIEILDNEKLRKLARTVQA
nr:Crp/Fnr family transcriptional regulator [Actinomadura rugatobispora]